MASLSVSCYLLCTTLRLFICNLLLISVLFKCYVDVFDCAYLLNIMHLLSCFSAFITGSLISCLLTRVPPPPAAHVSHGPHSGQRAYSALFPGALHSPVSGHHVPNSQDLRRQFRRIYFHCRAGNHRRAPRKYIFRVESCFRGYYATFSVKKKNFNRTKNSFPYVI